MSPASLQLARIAACESLAGMLPVLAAMGDAAWIVDLFTSGKTPKEVSGTKPGTTIDTVTP